MIAFSERMLKQDIEAARYINCFNDWTQAFLSINELPTEEKKILYGRATGIMQMKEMPFEDAIQFVPSYSAQEKIAVYSILGGVPHL